MFFTDQYINSVMIKTLKNFGGKKLGGVILIAVIIIAFGFGGFGGGFSTNNQNNIGFPITLINGFGREYPILLNRVPKPPNGINIIIIYNDYIIIILRLYFLLELYIYNLI